jgi:[ribosomal protein S5]-alanine N-acetyltransferase
MPLPTPTLHTARLRLRPFDDADAADLFALQSDATVLRYWDAPPWRDRARADRFIAACREMAEEGTGARLAVDRLSDGRFVGWCSLSRFDPVHRSASLGYCYGEAAWGSGIATEAARELLRWAFDALDLNRVQAETDTRNVASARVLEKARVRVRGHPARGLRRGRRGLRLVGLRADQAGVAAVVRAGSRPLSACSLARRRRASACFASARPGAGPAPS